MPSFVYPFVFLVFGCPNSGETPVQPAADPVPVEAAAPEAPPVEAAPEILPGEATAVDPTAADPAATADPTGDATTAEPTAVADAGTEGSSGASPTVGAATSGATVTLSGTYKVSGSPAGKLRIDINTVSPTGDPLKLETAVTLTAPGPWEAEVKRGLGPVRIYAFVDPGKRPPDNSPTATIQGLVVGNSSVGDLDLELVAGGKVVNLSP